MRISERPKRVRANPSSKRHASLSFRVRLGQDDVHEAEKGPDSCGGGFLFLAASRDCTMFVSGTTMNGFTRRIALTQDSG